MTDTDYVRRVTQLDDSHFLAERFRLTQPLSPHLAAAIDGVDIHLADFEVPRSVHHTHLVVEGAGGLLVPLNNTDFILDLIKQLHLPVCLVARSQLGTINHTLLSLNQLRQAEVPILGVIVNGVKNLANREAIAHYGQVPILGEVDFLDPINPQTLINAYHQLDIGK